MTHLYFIFFTKFHTAKPQIRIASRRKILVKIFSLWPF